MLVCPCVSVCVVRVINKRKLRGTNSVSAAGAGSPESGLSERLYDVSSANDSQHQEVCRTLHDLQLRFSPQMIFN